MKDRIEKLLKVVADKSKTPNNSYHQYQINRDFGYLLGMLAILELVESHQVNESEVNRLVDEIEKDYSES